jgi:hypothetical protein
VPCDPRVDPARVVVFAELRGSGLVVDLSYVGGVEVPRCRGAAPGQDEGLADVDPGRQVDRQLGPIRRHFVPTVPKTGAQGLVDLGVEVAEHPLAVDPGLAADVAVAGDDPGGVDLDGPEATATFELAHPRLRRVDPSPSPCCRLDVA